MVDKRKRAGSDAASLAHHASDASEVEHLVDEPPVAEEPSQNKTMVPFRDGAELHKVLQTPSADLLRLLLSRLRHQTSLSFAENTQRSSISANDKRIELVRDYCQLCETQASNSGAATSAAASIFSTWELADRQDLPTLLHLPIFCLAQSLALLSIHYPTQTLGSNIIERVLNTNEPWLSMLHDYISKLGGAKFASSKQRESRSKGSDVAALASLVLLREIATFAKGRYATKLFDTFNWSMKVLPYIFNMRRRTGRKSKTSKKAQVAQDVSLRRPDIRILYILFLLSFFQQSYSHNLKLRLLDLGKDFLPAMLKGLPQDAPDVVQTVLLHLHEDLVKDTKIPRSKIVDFWNEWACGCVVQLYSREGEHVLIHADSNAVENPSVAELAHHFLLSICTNPGFGICYPDRGWYPRRITSKDTATDAVDQSKTAAIFDDVDKDPFSADSSAAQKGKQGGGAIYNKVLSGVLRQLAVAEDLLQQELAVGILTACPELVGPYLESSCAGLSVDPKPSSKWLCNMAFFGRVIDLELPSFRNAKVEHLESSSDSATGTLVPHAHRLFALEPPPMSSVLANVLPGPLHRYLFSQGFSSSDRLVRYTTCALLCRCLNRLARFRIVCLSAIAELDEDANGPWRKHVDVLEMEARRRIPDISLVIQTLQIATSRSSTNGKINGLETENSADNQETDTSSDVRNMLSTEIALRLLSLYYQAVPSSAFDARFNAGKLLTNAFIQASQSPSAEDAADGDVAMAESDHAGSASINSGEEDQGSDSEAEEEQENGEISLNALCQVHTLRILTYSARAASFDWTAKPSGTSANLSYLGILLTLFVSTPLDQVKQACEHLLRTLLASSSFFEHGPAEIEAWLASLPLADTRAAEASRNTNPAVNEPRLSEEQQGVIAFLDECMLRCAKTPYRYIEAARQFLQDNGQDDVHHDSDLLASPWLMSLFEQFSIRLEKSLFTTDSGLVDSLMVFFARLLPSLCPYTRHTSALEAMANKIESLIDGNNTYASSAPIAAALVSKIRSISTAPISTLKSSSKTKPDKTSSALFTGSSTPAELRSRLRRSERPLTPAQVADLYDAIKELHRSGYASVAQILDELDPCTENIVAAAFQGSSEIELGTVPVLHLLSESAFVTPIRDDFMMTDEDEISDGVMLVPWQAKAQVRLAVWAAVNRSNEDQDLRHIRSLISIADRAEYLLEHEAKQFLFVNAVSVLDCEFANVTTSAILLQISDLAARYLDPERKNHISKAQEIVEKVSSASDELIDYFPCLTKLVPFLSDDFAVEVVGDCARVLETVDAESKIGLHAAETLSVITAALASSARIYKRLVHRLQSVVYAASQNGDPEDEEYEQDGRDALTFGVIQSVLQQVSHRADADLLKVIADLEAEKLVESISTTPAKDGALVAATLAHPTLAASISKSMIETLESEDVVMARSSPCTLATLLSALLEHGELQQDGSVSLAGQNWTDAHLEPVVAFGIDSVLGSTALSAEVAQKQAACLVVAFRCASRFNWTKTQSDVIEKLLTFANDALASSPQRAFRSSLMQALLGLVEAAPESRGLSDVLQVTMDASLLWLVRRFAENNNDTAALVDTIVLFTALLEHISEDSSFNVQLKKHLVDPAVQAAIKNRLRALDQMQLVRVLCKHAELESSHLSRYLGALSAHSDFSTIMRGNATVQRPLQQGTAAAAEVALEEEEVDDLNEQEKRQRADELKELMVELVFIIASRDAKALLNTALLTKLVSFYGATLSKFDRMLLSLFRKYEEECGSTFASLVQGWTLPASQGTSGVGVEGTTLEALQSLDANVVFATCTEFPRSLSLRNTIDSGYNNAEAAEEDGSEDDGDGMPGQVYGRHTDASQRYDPVFLSSLLAGVTSPEHKLSGLQWVSVFATNVPSLVVCGLSSLSADMRKASLTLITSVYLAVREADFQEKDHLIMVLDLLRDALHSATAIQDGSGIPSSAPFLPTSTTLFIAHSLRAVTTPASFIYPTISHFLLQRPELDVGDVPLLYSLLYSASDRYKQERMWMLRFLRDVARSGGRSDWKVFKRRRTWELVASLYDACDAGNGSGASAERAVEEAAMRALIEDTTCWLAKHADVAIELVTRRGLLTWVWQQLVNEGVVAMVDESLLAGETEKGKIEGGVNSVRPVSAPRSVWMLLVAQLVRSVDLDRLHRATEGAWIGSITTLVNSTIKAVHHCHTSSGSAAVPTVSPEAVHTITYAATMVLDKVISFASEDPTIASHLDALVDTLGLLVNLVGPSLESAQGKVKSGKQQSCTRIQRCLLTLASAPTLTAASSSKTQHKLAKFVRTSTAICKSFDSETASLVLANLFSV